MNAFDRGGLLAPDRTALPDFPLPHRHGGLQRVDTKLRRGERLATPGARGVRHVWDQVIQHGRTSYRINRDHPAIASLLTDRAQNPGVDAMLKLIEESIPVALIAYQSQEESETSASGPAESEVQSMRAMILQSWQGLRAKGLRESEALALLADWQPFNQHPALLQELRDNPPTQQ